MQACTWLIYVGVASDSGACLSAVSVLSLVLKCISTWKPGTFDLTDTSPYCCLTNYTTHREAACSQHREGARPL
jgi:hypothetical protein